MHRTRSAIVATAIAVYSLIGLPPAHAATQTVSAVAFTYIGSTPNKITIRRHDRLRFQNLDLLGAHTITSNTHNLFKSPVVNFGETRTVSGVIVLPPGTYKFHCTLHTFMHGTIVVT